MRAFCLTLLAMVLFPCALAQEAPSDLAWYEPGYDDPVGKTELVAVYFGGSTCGPCRFPAYKAALRRAVAGLHARAENEGQAFAFVGVANDWDVEDGLAFLNENGPFDAVVVGRNWYNDASVEHLFENDAATPALPTLVVYERDVTRSEDGQPEFGEKRYLTALRGGQIFWWFERESPLPYSIDEDMAGMTEEERGEVEDLVRSRYAME